MSGRKLFLAILVFLIYQAAVWGLVYRSLPAPVSLIASIVLTACGNTLLALYAFALYPASQPQSAPGTEAQAWPAADATAWQNPEVAPQQPSYQETHWPAPETPAPAPEPQPVSPALPWPTPEAAPVTPVPATNPPRPGDSRPGVQREIAPPAALIEEARRKLGTLPPESGIPRGASIGNLPMHFVFGPEGCGKTTLVLLSEIGATLLAGQGRPARNVWLVGNSLLVEQGGAGCWADPVESRRFLESFGQPSGLRDVILCFPIELFLGIQDVTRLAALADHVRGHLLQIGAVAGRTFPVYIVFTKSDAVPFFREYFGVLADPERRQVLGCTLPEPLGGGPDSADGDQEAQNRRITAGFNSLYVRLAEKRLTFLNREADPVRKGAIYEFPREMRRIRGTVVQFLANVARRDPAQPGGVLRGFYFTGSTPAHDAAAEKQFFAADLFRQILLPPGSPAPAAAPPDSPRPVRSDRQFAPVGALALAGLLLCLYSGYQNHSLLLATRAAAATCRPLESDAQPSTTEFEGVDRLRRQVETLVRYHDNQPPLSMRLGLYSGDEVIAPIRQLYFRRFQQYFLTRVARHLESEFAALPPRQSPSYPYATIRAHLAVYRTITGHPDDEIPDSAIAEWLLLIWRDSPGWNPRFDPIAMANFALYGYELKRQRPQRDLEFNAATPGTVQRASDYLHYFKTGSRPESP